MTTLEKPKYTFDTFDLIIFIKEKFKILFFISIIGAIVSAGVSFVITEKYKSTVVLFPAPSTSVSKSLLTDNITTKTVSKFGEEEEVEQLLQVLNSDEIRETILRKHNLMQHYEIEPDSKYPRTNLIKKYKKNINCRRTEFMSIEIEVMDKDPHMAAKIANDIAALLDSVMNRMEHERALKALKIVEKEYFALQAQMKELGDSLTKIRQKGVIDYESQAEVFNKAYAEALARGDLKAAEKLENKLKILAKYGGAYVSIRDFLESETEQLALIKARYAEAKVDASANLPHKFIVNSAYPAEKKSYPIRWLIVVVSTIATFIISLLAMLVIDIFRQKK